MPKKSEFAKKMHLLAGASLAITALSAAPPAFAQAVGAEEDSTIADIVVTARKREENLQDTPIAITAITADAIDARGLNDLSQVAASTPNLAFTVAPQNANKGSASVFLRGVGQLDYRINTDPGVGIYIDGVYLARNVGAMLDFTDIDRVEVLRGPQGTLFGRNTIGGAINVISAQPSAEPGGSATFTTGSFERMQVQATANMPISDELFTRVSVFGHLRNGYMERVQTGQDAGDDDVWGGRVQLRWEPTANFTADLSIDGTSRDENAGPLKLLDAAAFGFAANDTRNPGPVLNPPSVFNNAILGGICSTAAADTSLSCFGAAWVTADPYTTNDTYGDRTTLDIFGTSLTLDWDVGFMNIRSISSYRHLEAYMARDTDHTPFDLFHFTTDDDQDQTSQELQFSGDAFNNRLNWMFGLYYFNEDGVEIYNNFNRAAFDAIATVAVNNTSIAAFTENTLDITDRLHLTAGLRWTRDTKDFSIDIPIVADFSPAPPALGGRLVTDNSNQELSSERLTPRLTLSYDFSDDLMTYVTYSEGYKSGGFNAIYSAVTPAPVPFNPEEVTQYEAGVKFQTDTLRLNLAAFHSEYSDIQVNYRPNPALVATVIGNAAAGEIDGFEGEFTWAPVHGLTLEGGIGWIDARYTTLDPGLAPLGITTSTPFVNTPELSGSLAVSYEIPIGAFGSLTPRVDYSYRDNVVYDNTNSLPARQDAVSLLNANITWRSPDENWRVIFGGLNLTDETYLVTAAYNRAAGVAEGLYGRPREWYLSVRREF